MTALRGFVFAGAAILALCFTAPAQAVIVLGENFNDDIDNDATDAPFAKSDGGGSTPFFNNPDSPVVGSDAYWGIHDPVGSTDDYDGDAVPGAGSIPAYSLFAGNYLVGENLDDDSPINTLPVRLDWSNLPISGLTALSFSTLFAADKSAGVDFESGVANGDFMQVQYRIDSDVAAFIPLLYFAGDASGQMSLDTDFDLTGDSTVLTTPAQSFSAAIAGTGSTLDLRILMSTTTSGEQTALDEIAIVGVPEPSAFLFGGLVCGVFAFGYAGRKMFSSNIEKSEKTEDLA